MYTRKFNLKSECLHVCRGVYYKILLFKMAYLELVTALEMSSKRLRYYFLNFFCIFTTFLFGDPVPCKML